MKIVIDIPDKDYQMTLTKIMLACYGHKITELPKGHGALKDTDAIFEKFEETGWFNNADRDEVAERILLNAPTIIDADKEVDE